MTNTMLFRVLSGVHEGAQIELSPGVWVVGSDESCDIILGDGLAPRHAAVTLTEDGHVRIAGLDAAVLGLHGEARAGEEVAAGEIVRLGDVAIAWGPGDAGSSFWRDVKSAWAQRGAPPQGKDSAEAVQTPAPTGTTAAEAVHEAQEEKPEARPEESVRPRASHRVAAAATGLALCGLVLWGVYLTVLLTPGWRAAVEEKLAGLTPSKVALAADAFSATQAQCWERRLSTLGLDVRGRRTQEEAARTLEALQARLKARGLDDVSVRRLENGTYVFMGMVEDDAERAQLFNDARQLDAPAVLQVQVKSDRTEPVKAAFNTLDLWPGVRWERTNSGESLLVSGYMLDSVVEEKAFAEVTAILTQNQAASPALVLKRRILHRPEVSATLSQAMAREKLSGVSVQWLDGRIRLLSVLTPETKVRLDRVMEDVRSRSGVPLAIEVVNQEPAAVPGARKPVVATVSAVRNPDKPAFRVTSVSGGALKFVTLSDGSKIFEGGLMPGGFTLESISYNRLVLTRNKKRINYPLKVTK